MTVPHPNLSSLNLLYGLMSNKVTVAQGKVLQIILKVSASDKSKVF
jgi:hypothetical protein